MNQKSLYLETRTFKNEFNNLFDYESTNTKDKDIVLNTTSYITRNNQYINSNNNLPCNNKEEFLFKVNHDNNNFIIENDIKNNIIPTEQNIRDLNNKIWYVLKRDPNQSRQIIDNNNEDYYLCINDIIKVGRSKLLVSEINIPKRQNNIDIELNEEEDDDANIYGIDNLNRYNEPVLECSPLVKDASEFNDIPNEEKICKVCYLGDYDRFNNPLINMCDCNGGIKFTHFLCIKKWMKTKIIVRENSKKTVKSYYLQNFNCEICKAPYHNKFKIKDLDKTFELIDIEKPNEENYLVLESLNQVKNNSNNKSIHVAKLTGDDLILGRNSQSDIFVREISVSRNHSLIKYNSNDGKILIRDYKSKFGTLVLVKRPLVIKDQKICLQIGCSYIAAHTKNTKKFHKALFKVEHFGRQEINDIDNNIKKDKMIIEEDENR